MNSTEFINQAEAFSYYPNRQEVNIWAEKNRGHGERTRGRSFCLVLPLFLANTLNHCFTDSGKP